MWLLLLAACERDPALFGYWDIVVMRAGPTEADAQDAGLAGFLEFTASGECYGVFGYTWSGLGWEPDPTPDLLTFTTDARAQTELIESYKSKGETYTVTMTVGGEDTTTFELLDWKGSSVTLSSADATLPGAWGTGSARGFFEMELER